jgi:antitoxin component YwqK of YwqJK toxin-antitoxin module
MRLRITVIIVFVGITSLQVAAQQQEEPQDQAFTVDSPVNLDFYKEEEPINTKKKKVKKKVFYGIKTKKGFTRRGTGDRVTFELFYYLKKSESTKTFVRDIYFYDYTRREIRRTSKFDPTKGVLLHGPYKRVMNQVVMEEGIYYKGTRHGRWMTYNRDSTLTDKAKYFRGWPKESLVTYYDPLEKKKVKEITPIEFGEKEGFYYMFHENGLVAVTGEYKFNEKVGNWIEYYPSGKRKKLVAYSKEAFDKEVIPYVKTEWNEKGKEIYRNNKMSTK